MGQTSTSCKHFHGAMAHPQYLTDEELCDLIEAIGDARDAEGRAGLVDILNYLAQHVADRYYASIESLCAEFDPPHPASGQRLMTYL